MLKFCQVSLLAVSILFSFFGNNVQALPGQSTDEAVSWINGNATLRPALGDGLVVKKSETPAHRFQFQASVLPPGRVHFPRDRTMIRSERFSFYDMINGVTNQRLIESLRNIYGVNIYQDFQRAELVYEYPSQEMIQRSRRQNLPLLAARKGELRRGEKYAYWIEIVETENNLAFDGQMTVFLPEDLEKLEQELRAH